MPQNTLQCPPGSKLRKGYNRTFRNSVRRKGYTVRRHGKLFYVRPSTATIHVPDHCIPTRQSKRNTTRKIGPLRKGLLIKFGYQYRLSDRLRHAALEKAAKAYGPHRLVQMLTAVANLTVHTAPDAHKIFARDQDWVSEKFLKK